MYLNYSNPTLANVIIHGNTVSSSGGGIKLERSNPNLINVTISDNTAEHGSGGILCYRSNPSLTNVTISGNSQEGVILDANSSGILINMKKKRIGRDCQRKCKN